VFFFFGGGGGGGGGKGKIKRMWDNYIIQNLISKIVDFCNWN